MAKLQIFENVLYPLKTKWKESKSFRIALIISGSLLVIAALIAIFSYIWEHHTISHLPNSNVFIHPAPTLNIPSATVLQTLTPTSTPTQTSQNYTNYIMPTLDDELSTLYTPASGNLTLLTDLNLYIQTDSTSLPRSYYDDGLIQKGKYSGYHRIISIVENYDVNIDTFATNDMQHFILVGKQYAQSSFDGVYTNNVTEDNNTIDPFPTLLPIDTESNLKFVKYLTYTQDTSLKDSLGNILTVTKFSVPLDPKIYTPAPFSIPGFSVYQEISQQAVDKNGYFPKLSRYFVVDPTGIAAEYSEVPTSMLEAYKAAMSEINQQIVTYNTGIPSHLHDQSYSTRLTVNLSTLGDFLLSMKSDFITQTAPATQLYPSYSVLAEGGCSRDPSFALVSGITANDLTQIGTIGINSPAYVLKDPNSPILKELYADHVSSISVDDFKSSFNVAPPSYTQYVANNPLIIIDGYNGEYYAIAESNFTLGGCGKPVIYLYPPKPTEVKISFESPVSFHVQVPTYHNEWDVLAMPNGILHDLQPSYTSCNLLNTNSFGLVYAKQACESNAYPYIYWSGTIASIDYPEVSEGSIVTRNDLESFMNSTLDYIGLTSQEKSDMLSYWVPEMLKSNKPYYRITIFQNTILNRLFPMHISPQPDSVNRIFLDYLPLDNPHQVAVAPQHFQHFIRKGFTYVEWGGLIRN